MHLHQDIRQKAGGELFYVDKQENQEQKNEWCVMKTEW